MAKPQKSGITDSTQKERAERKRTYSENVKRSEDTIRNQPNEYMIMLDDNGNIKYQTTDGEVDSVGMSKEMIANAIDSVVSHNHPGGSCFSPEDIMVAMYYQLREVRATTASNGTYVLRRTHETGKPPVWNYRNLPSLYDYARKHEIHERIQKGIYEGTVAYTKESIAKAYNEACGEWLKANAKKFGWEFRKED